MQIPRRIALASLGLLPVATSAAVPPAADTAADEAALRVVDQSFMQAYWKGDLETVVALYAEDDVLLPANAPAARGRYAIRQYFAADMDNLKPGDTGVIVQSTQGVSGNIGWSSGRSGDTAASGLTSRGKFLSVSRKMHGQWLYSRDAWNSDGP